MRRHPVREIAIGLAALLAATGCAGATENEPSSGQKDEIVIGAVGLRVGPAPIVGRDLGTAMTDWFEMINEQGGINGRTVRFLEIEAQYDTAKGIEAYGKLKQEGAVGFFPLGLGNALALGPMAQADEMVMLATGTGQTDTLDGTTAPYEFSGGASYPAQFAAMVQYATEDWKEKGNTGQPRFGSLCWDNPAGKASCASVRAAAEKLGAEVVIESFIAPTTADVTPQALRFQEEKPDYVFLGGGGKTPQLTLKAFRELGMDIPVFNVIWGFNDDVWDPVGAAANGYTGASLAQYATSDTKAYQQLRDYWEKAGKTPPDFFEEPFYAQGLAMASLMTEGIRQADLLANGKAITGPLLKQGLEAVKDFDADGLICPVTMSATDHLGVRAVSLYTIKDEKPTLVGDCVEGPDLD